MRKTLTCFLLSIALSFTFHTCVKSQSIIGNCDLVISEHIDLSDDDSLAISALKSFFASKRNSLTSNENWVQQDFEIYKFPFIDVAYIDINREGQVLQTPVVLEIISVESGFDKIIKVAFMSCKDKNKIKAIYNFYATKDNGIYKLKRILSYNSKDWIKHDYEKIVYYTSPKHLFNEDQAQKTISAILMLEKYFDTRIDKVTYFSCVNPKEIFEIKGFDYLPNMYFSTKGGLNEKFSNIIFSGNDSDSYDHELVHLFTFKKFGGAINQFIDEGLSTYLGGSSGYNYDYHKRKFQDYLVRNSKINLTQFMNPYLENSDLDSETSLPYILGGVLCEYAEKKGGKDLIYLFLKSGFDNSKLWNEMEKVGLSKDNFDEKIRNFILDKR